jgi:hypothetical protein
MPALPAPRRVASEWRALSPDLLQHGRGADFQLVRGAAAGRREAAVHRSGWEEPEHWRRPGVCGAQLRDEDAFASAQVFHCRRLGRIQVGEREATLDVRPSALVAGERLRQRSRNWLAGGTLDEVGQQPERARPARSPASAGRHEGQPHRCALADEDGDDREARREARGRDLQREDARRQPFPPRRRRPRSGSDSDPRWRRLRSRGARRPPAAGRGAIRAPAIGARVPRALTLPQGGRGPELQAQAAQRPARPDDRSGDRPGRVAELGHDAMHARGDLERELPFLGRLPARRGRP